MTPSTCPWKAQFANQKTNLFENCLRTPAPPRTPNRRRESSASSALGTSSRSEGLLKVVFGLLVPGHTVTITEENYLYIALLYGVQIKEETFKFFTFVCPGIFAQFCYVGLQYESFCSVLEFKSENAIITIYSTNSNIQAFPLAFLLSTLFPPSLFPFLYLGPPSQISSSLPILSSEKSFLGG